MCPKLFGWLYKPWLSADLMWMFRNPQHWGRWRSCSCSLGHLDSAPAGQTKIETKVATYPMFLVIWCVQLHLCACLTRRDSVPRGLWSHQQTITISSILSNLRWLYWLILASLFFLWSFPIIFSSSWWSSGHNFNTYPCSLCAYTNRKLYLAWALPGGQNMYFHMFAQFRKCM